MKYDTAKSAVQNIRMRQKGEVDESGFDPLDYLVPINEEGEDEDDDIDEVDEEPEEDEGGAAEAPAEGGSGPAPFQNLQLVEAFCFGWCTRAADLCWANIADGSVSKGWKNSDIQRLDVDLKKNVDACYFFPCQGVFEDIDTGFRWRAAFVADHMMWKLEILGGSEVLPEDAKAFFGCDYFKKFSKRCGDLIDRARKIYVDVVDPHLKSGELMQVDPIKLDRIIHDTGVTRFMDNLRGGKYELQ